MRSLAASLPTTTRCDWSGSISHEHGRHDRLDSWQLLKSGCLQSDLPTVLDTGVSHDAAPLDINSQSLERHCKRTSDRPTMMSVTRNRELPDELTQCIQLHS